ncbi:MAG: glycosyltransferase [Verrucomicrobiota bacterium]|jgi:poly(glycerol-phosphate) alpha-glucosyltransferase
MINCVNFTTSLSRNAGGLYESVRSLVKAQKKHKVNVSIFGNLDDHSYVDLVAWYPIAVRAYHPKFNKQFGYSKYFARDLENIKPDIMHTHGLWTYPSVLTHSYCSQKSIPYIISPHGMLDPWAMNNSRFKKIVAYHIFEKKHLQGAMCLRALCESEANSMRLLGLRQPICIIPNGIKMPKGVQCEKQMPKGQENGKKTLLFLGRIHPKKGLLNGLRAFKKALDASPSTGGKAWQFVIAGWDQGGHEAALMQLCEEIGLSFIHKIHNHLKGSERTDAEVIFYGPAFKEEKKRLLENTDAFILSSFSEGLPMSVLEAWSYGIPTLITPECNLPEGEAAHAVIPIKTDVEAITGGLNTLFSMSDQDLRDMGSKGEKLVLERFTWDSVAEQMRDVYGWMLGRRDSAATLRFQ